MLFKTKEFYIDKAKEEDFHDIIDIYNSNKNFLLIHMDKENITKSWLTNEFKQMENVGFYSCKIVDIDSNKIIGLMDFKIEEETYLSLMMIHGNLKNKGMGKKVFQSFEEYVLSKESKKIKIDVVINYSKDVLTFWRNNGFVKVKEVELNWTGKVLPAITMMKIL
ncbi:GNAT family N-acetyltransferase [Clostridium sp. SHJSY1]|uniref:GNAT family N-acetyltransferase n=1 Tax=Clostridium sp. SHJSY1 TaxID=2942483 RepID=UPI002874793A|nr:GNAT family N-acetyltransferase [Clostridium sp. SHJSY1]MDS0526754.1 GNAT family N-acetyltransferase [Clostridium sp. SHJSY1]